ncbi:MAG: fasciclin domain-containing protein [Allosphingosinicella sp.]
MRKLVPVTAALFALAAAPAAFAGGKAPMVGGAAMYPSRNIVENAVQSKSHTTLVAAVKAAGLVDTLSGAGPFTVFAPTNDAFAKLPAGTVDTLLQPANKQMLQSVLTYHVVPGRVSAAQLVGQIEAGKGMAKLATVQGGTLTARLDGGKVVLTDEKGGRATVTQADIFQSNGVIHVTDAVSLPR